jgi:DNA-directed RNA polymerase specialized sigma24 family protein
MALWADPEIQRFALRRAGDPDLAQDALLHAICAVARVDDLERINDLRAYLCRAIINEVYRLRGQLAGARRYESASLDEMAQRGEEKPSASAPPVDEAAITRLMAQAWLERFGADRDRLRASVPGRSSKPDRYRDLIAAVAEHLLCAALDGGLSRADSNEELQAAFPDWFGLPGDDQNTHHQHLSRARRDVQAVLQAVVNRDELVP